MTQLEVQAAVNDIVQELSGRIMAYYGNYPGESLVPIARYIEKLTTISPLPDSIYNWPTQLPGALQERFAVKTYQAGSTYPLGSILFWNAPHVALVLEATGDTMARVFDQQNGQPCATHDVIVTDCTYVLVPIIEAASKPAMVYVSNDIATVDGRQIHVQRLAGEAPRRMYVKKPEGTMLMDFDGQIDTHRDFIGVPGTHYDFRSEVRIMGTAHHPVVPTGMDFYITLDDWGEFTKTGQLNKMRGFYASDLSLTLPPIPVIPDKPAPTASMDIKTKTTYLRLKPEDMGFVWFNDEHVPVKYQVMQPVAAVDYIQPRSQWGKTRRVLYKPTIVAAYGTFKVDNRLMLLLRMEGAGIFDYWYGVPEVGKQGQRLLEEVPDFTELREAVPMREYGFGTRLFSHIAKLEVVVKHGIFKVKR